MNPNDLPIVTYTHALGTTIRVHQRENEFAGRGITTPGGIAAGVTVHGYGGPDESATMSERPGLAAWARRNLFSGEP